MGDDTAMVLNGGVEISRSQAVANGSKGGQSRSMAKKLARRKYCSPRCPYFEDCLYAPTAYSENNRDNRGKYPCLFRQMPAKVQKFHLRCTDGEEGFDNMLRDLQKELMEMELVNPSKTGKASLMHQIRENKKAIFGDKRRYEGSIAGSQAVQVNIVQPAAPDRGEDQEKKEGDIFTIDVEGS